MTGWGEQCPLHPIVESALERNEAALERAELLVDDIRRDISSIQKDQAAVRIAVSRGSDEIVAMSERMTAWTSAHDRIDEVRREDFQRRVAALEAESDQWREDTQSQSREALTLRAHRAESHLERLANELRGERDTAAKREEKLLDELRAERARRDSLRVHGEVAATARWKIWGAVALGVVGSLTAIVQAIVGR